MAADSNFLMNLGVLGQTPIIPSKKGLVRPSQPDPNFMQNIGAFGSQSSPKPAASAPADPNFMQNIGAFSGSPRAEDPMKMLMREAGRTDVNRGLLDDGSFGFKDVYGRALVNGQIQKAPERQIFPTKEVRENANRVVQTGKDLSGRVSAASGRVSAAFVPEYANSSFNQLLAGVNTAGHQPFSSNQLPTTAGSPDAAISPKTQQILAGIQAGKEADMSIEGYQEPTSSAKAGVLSGIRGGARTDRRIQGTPTAADGVLAGIQGGQKTDQGIEGYKKPGSTSRLDAALSDTAGINSYMKKFSSGDRERAANRAFLDTEGSQAGLRAKEAVNRVVYAGGQHSIPGTSGDDKAIPIDRSQARDIANGKQTAAGLLEAYKSRITEAQKDTPAESQDPLSAAGSAVKSGFATGAQTDFALNNNQGAPQIGVGPVVPANVIENYDFSKPGAEEDYFRPGGILDQYTKKK